MAVDYSDYCECESGTRLPFPQPGHVRSIRDENYMVPCPLHEACLGAPRLYENVLAAVTESKNNSSSSTSAEYWYGVCANGYKNQMCGGCDMQAGYFHIGNKCAQCDEQTEKQAMMFLVLILLIICLMAYAVHMGAFFFKNGAISVLCDYFQLQGVFWTYNLNWPEEANNFMQELSIFNFNFDLFGVTCLFSSELSWYDSWVLKMCFPLMLVIGFGLVYLAYYALFILDYFSMKAHEMHRAHCINAVLFTVSVLCSYIATNSFAIFHCLTLEDGTTFLNDYPQEDCGTPMYWNYAGTLGVMGILVNIVGIPFTWFWFLRRNKDKLKDPVFKKQYGALYVVYTEDCYYWEIIVKLKKIFTLAFVVFFPDNLPFQVFAGKMDYDQLMNVVFSPDSPSFDALKLWKFESPELPDEFQAQNIDELQQDLILPAENFVTMRDERDAIDANDGEWLQCAPPH
ncbi:hypothetical protein CYMTET_6389 [Cymbomonas tetramitiformis]|uniref:Uncharacterized protein n=1 Tax=Cymbomonas tetramitiformis TaxID=36881 RepID=A0AAE0GXQ5_9CHLO|nr:hypothetical protein CYMTET_6389 [Cymbomonas tetramitiformis]